MGEEWIINFESKIRKAKLEAENEDKKMRCIKRVPKVARSLNEGAFTPQVVSIGPYHHDQDHLKPMEPTKYEAVSNYLTRAEKTLAQVVEAMRPIAKDLMEAYHGLEEKWKNEERFVELMIADGCFFLDDKIWQTVLSNDPYFDKKLRMDMLMIENQLPLSALAVLIEVGGHEAEDTKKFINRYWNVNEQLRTIRGMGLHHLDLYRKGLTSIGDYFYDYMYTVPPASELILAGVQFTQNNTISLKNISFNNGVMCLPFLLVHEFTRTELLNLIAYELMIMKDESVLSYATLMDDLINTVEDVKLLRERKILIGYVGSDYGVVDIFNGLSKVRPAKGRSIGGDVNYQLNVYCDRSINRWRASFWQSYLKNPWVFLSLLGALTLLVLTVVQTTYTVITYYQ